MTDPIYIAQSAEPMTKEARLDWFRARADEAKAAGAVIARATIHPDIANLTLFEAWDDATADQGEPNWQLTYKDQAHGE